MSSTNLNRLPQEARLQQALATAQKAPGDKAAAVLTPVVQLVFDFFKGNPQYLSPGFAKTIQEFANGIPVECLPAPIKEYLKTENTTFGAWVGAKIQEKSALSAGDVLHVPAASDGASLRSVSPALKTMVSGAEALHLHAKTPSPSATGTAGSRGSPLTASLEFAERSQSPAMAPFVALTRIAQKPELSSEDGLSIAEALTTLLDGKLLPAEILDHTTPESSQGRERTGTLSKLFHRGPRKPQEHRESPQDNLSKCLTDTISIAMAMGMQTHALGGLEGDTPSSAMLERLSGALQNLSPQLRQAPSKMKAYLDGIKSDSKGMGMGPALERMDTEGHQALALAIDAVGQLQRHANLQRSNVQIQEGLFQALDRMEALQAAEIAAKNKPVTDAAETLMKEVNTLDVNADITTYMRGNEPIFGAMRELLKASKARDPAFVNALCAQVPADLVSLLPAELVRQFAESLKAHEAIQAALKANQPVDLTISTDAAERKDQLTRDIQKATNTVALNVAQEIWSTAGRIADLFPPEYRQAWQDFSARIDASSGTQEQRLAKKERADSNFLGLRFLSQEISNRVLLGSQDKSQPTAAKDPIAAAVKGVVDRQFNSTFMLTASTGNIEPAKVVDFSAEQVAALKVAKVEFGVAVASILQSRG